MKGASPETCEILPSAPKTKTWFVYQRDDAAPERCAQRPLMDSI